MNDPDSKEPGNNLCSDLIEEAMNQGVIFGHSAPISSDSGKLFRNVLKIKPPLIITREDSDHIITVFESALKEAKSKRKLQEILYTQERRKRFAKV